MNIRFLTPTWHGLVDYLAAIELLTMPFVLRLGTSAPLAKWLAVATGLAVILVGLLTDYKLGLVKIIPFRIHLAIDTAVATAFVVGSVPVRLHWTRCLVLLDECGRRIRGRGGQHARSRKANAGTGVSSAAVHGNPTPA